MSVQQGPMDLSHLRGTVVVVTGAGNGGIGFGIAQRAAELGMHVAVLDLHERVVQDASAALSKEFPAARCIGVRCDVTKLEDMMAAAGTVETKFQGMRIGAVFANAGVVFDFNSSIVKSGMEHWRDTLDVNVLGVVHTIKAFVPLLQRSAEPSVMCTVSSTGGLIRAGGPAHYCASKHAAVSISESLSLELARKYPQIRVCVCCPCLVRTGLPSTSEINKKAKAAKKDSQVSQLDMDKLPGMNSESIKSLFMTPKRHGDQVWDRIAAGEFYMICDNIRPYVDHDFPFNGIGQALARVKPLFKPDLQRSVDNSRAFGGLPPDDERSPLNEEMRRRARAQLEQARATASQPSKL